MAISTVNATLIKYESSSTYTTIYPKTLANNITITSNSNYSTTNLQTLVSALGSLAFRSYTIVTSASSAASGTLVDGSVIKEMNSTLTTLQEEVDSMSSVGGGTIFTGATNDSNGTPGLVPAPLAGEENYFLCANGTWVEISTTSSGTESTGSKTLITTTTKSYSYTGSGGRSVTANADGSYTYSGTSMIYIGAMDNEKVTFDLTKDYTGYSYQVVVTCSSYPDFSWTPTETCVFTSNDVNSNGLTRVTLYITAGSYTDSYSTNVTVWSRDDFTYMYGSSTRTFTIYLYIWV